MIGKNQGVTKRCRLSWLTNSALVYEPKCGERGEITGLQPMVQLYTGAQINVGDLTPYLTYGKNKNVFHKNVLFKYAKFSAFKSYLKTKIFVSIPPFLR